MSEYVRLTQRSRATERRKSVKKKEGQMIRYCSRLPCQRNPLKSDNLERKGRIYTQFTMPEMTGVELLRRQQATEAHRQIHLPLGGLGSDFLDTQPSKDSDVASYPVSLCLFGIEGKAAINGRIVPTRGCD